MMKIIYIRVTAFGSQKVSLHQFRYLENVQLKTDHGREGGSLKASGSGLVHQVTKALVRHRSSLVSTQQTRVLRRTLEPTFRLPSAVAQIDDGDNQFKEEHMGNQTQEYFIFLLQSVQLKYGAIPSCSHRRIVAKSETEK